MSKKFIFEGYVTWAKLFTENMDKADFHMEKGDGAYTCNFYFKNEEDIQKLIDAGMPESQLGYDTFREPEEFMDDDSNKYMKLKRYHKGPFLTDEGVDIYGGPPVVYDHTDGPSSTEWDFQYSGPLGNGTEVKVILELWSTKRGKGVRLLEVAVIDQVSFNPEDVEVLSLAG